MYYKVEIVEINKLKEHEEIDTNHLKKLIKEIKSYKILKRPIVVDKNTNIILDGAHRFNALKALGCKKIPAVLVNYRSPKIKVMSWRKGEKIDKKDVIIAGVTGNKMPPKTSKHMILINGRLKHISFIEKIINFPIEKLK
jgi:hypothetical protein